MKKIIVEAPALLSGSMPWQILFLTFLAAIMSFVLGNFLKARLLLYLGYMIPAGFWLSTIIGGRLHGGYVHLHMAVSEAGALGTPSQLFMSVSELVLGLFSIYFFIGVYGCCRQMNINTVPAWMVLGNTISMVGVAFFPLHHSLHPVAGNFAFFLIFGELLSIVLWRKVKELRLLTAASLLALAIFTGLFLRFIPDLQAGYGGLIQRSFHLSWSVWYMALAYNFRKVTQVESITASERR